ncbi:MAG: hypothetical protein IJ642_06865 [Oscillospiraceae bacterium]|nr:hypothetical protein [Oscillospiraceae bacterium]
MIRDSAFNDNRINYVDLKNVTYIGAGAFGNNIDYLFDETDTAHYATNPNKRYIFIPETVEFIGDGAFGFFGYTIGDDTTTGASYRGAIHGFIVKDCTDVAKKYAESIGHGVQVWAGGQGSYTNAENYFNYEEAESDTPPVIPDSPTGDANGDGKTDILDVITVNKAVLGKESISSDRIPYIDFNGDGKPDSTDSLTILKKIVGLI